VIEDCDKFSEKSIDIGFSVKLLPVLERNVSELLKELLLLKVIDLLSFLTVALGIESDELKKQVLADLH
jgi:hypothetical protein